MKKDTGEVIISGCDLDSGRGRSITLKDGFIGNVSDKTDITAGVYLAPGLIDLQVNGYKGYDINQTCEHNGIGLITKSLWSIGVTTYLPTVITNDSSKISAILNNIAQACTRDRLIDDSIAGIHLEGPFISPEDGPRGAHPKEFVRPPDWDLFCRWQEAAGGRIKIVTLSPEWPEALLFIAKCVESGVKVAIGHTAANPAQISEAVVAGATLSTHLGNGSHPLLPRLINYIWQQLAEDSLYATLIADGFHLPDSVLKVIMKVKSDKALLVSDSVYLAGMEPGEYYSHIGGKVVLTPEGRLHLGDNPLLLAGSVQPLLDGVSNLAKKQLKTLAEAWAMASTGPARFIGLPVQNGLRIGAPADCVLVEAKDGRLKILQTYKSGVLVYDNSK